jgi:nucleotide-binding universal stress UspA family protein
LSIGSRTEIFLRQAAEHRAVNDEMPAPAEPLAGPGEPSEPSEPSEQSAPTILTLVDMTADDVEVVDAAAALARESRATIVLLHVARPLPRRRRAWQLMLAIEAAAQKAMRRLAGRWLPRSHLVRTSVRFGDVVEQVAKAVMAVGATVVVAASRPAGWRWWRHRDRRLRRAFDPVVLVRAREEAPGQPGGLTRPAPARSTGTRAAA